MTIKLWLVRTALLALGFGMLMAGAGMLRNMQLRQWEKHQQMEPSEAVQTYRERINETNRMLRNGSDMMVVSDRRTRR